MPSFDIVSELNMQELDNAINQAIKEVKGRFDFRGSKAEISWDRKALSFVAEDDYKMATIKDILQSKAHKRGIDIVALKFNEIEKIGGMMMRQTVELVQGIEKEVAKKITKSIAEAKLKVQAQIQGELIRVTSKSIDELQATMSHCRKEKFGIPLQFNNMRS
jgi:cyclic-di-GMP-binding protein